MQNPGLWKLHTCILREPVWAHQLQCSTVLTHCTACTQSLGEGKLILLGTTLLCRCTCCLVETKWKTEWQQFICPLSFLYFSTITWTAEDRCRVCSLSGSWIQVFLLRRTMKEGIPTVHYVGMPACCCPLASGEDAWLLLSSGLRGPLQNTIHQTQSLNKTVKH